MSISFNGLASGLDTSSWVESLVALKQAKVDTLKEEKEVKLLSRDTLNSIKSFFNSFRATLEKITDVKLGVPSMDIFSQKLAHSSDVQKVTASVTTEAEESTYNIEVNQLATQTQASSNIMAYTTITQTYTATGNTKLADLGVKSGEIGVTVNGIKNTVKIEDSDTIGSFITKLENLGVDASFNEKTGIFGVNLKAGDIDDTLTTQADGTVGTGIVQALNLKEASGYESSSLQSSTTEVVEQAVTKDTKLSALGTINAGNIEVKANDTTYTIAINETTTFGDLLNSLKANNIESSLSSDGIFSIKDAEIVDVGNTGIIDALGLTTTVNSKTQVSKGLQVTQNQSVTTVANGTTKLQEIGAIQAGNITVKDSGGVAHTISITPDMTFNDLISSLNAVGINANLDSDGHFTIETSEIVDTDSTGIIDVLKLQKDSSSSSTNNQISSNLQVNSITSTTITTIATGTEKISEFGTIQNGNIQVDVNGVKHEIAINKDMTLNAFMSALQDKGVDVTLSNAGVLEIKNTEIVDIGGTGIIAALGLNQTVASKTQTATNLKETVSVVAPVSGLTKLSALAGIQAGNVAFTDYNGISHTIAIDESTTFQNLIDELQAKGIQAELKPNGQFIIQSSNINDVGNTGIIDALQLQFVAPEPGNFQTTGKINYKKTTTQTVAVTENTTLKDLGARSGNIIVDGNGVNKTISVDNTTSIKNFVSQLQNNGIDASYVGNEFRLENQTIRDLDCTGIVEALNLTTVSSGNSQGMAGTRTQYDSVTTTYQEVTNDMKLSDIGEVYNGSIDLMVGGTNYNIAIDQNTTIQGLVDDLNLKGAQAEYQNGILTLNNGVITSTASTNVDKILQLKRAESNINNVHSSGTIQYNKTTVQRTPVTSATKLNELGNVTQGQIQIVTDNGSTHSVTISGETSMQDLVTSLSNIAGVSASITSSGVFQLEGARIEDPESTGIIPVLNLTDNSTTNKVTQTSVALSSRITEEQAIAQGYTVIKTAQQLQSINNKLDGKYILMNDIDMQGVDFTPIGGSGEFTGIFDGNGYTVKNVSFSNGSTDAVGFFAKLNRATISNLTLENVNITGRDSVGALAGVANSSTITNCHASGYVSAIGAIGGMVGMQNSTTFKDSSTSGTIHGNSQMGGFVGFSEYGSFDNINTSIDIISSGMDVGSFIGYKKDSLNNITNSTYNKTLNPDKAAIGNIAGEIVGLTTTTSPVIIEGIASRKLSEFGVTFGNIKVVQNGVISSIMVASNDTLQDFIDKLNGAGMSATLVSSNGMDRIVVEGTGNSYIESDTSNAVTKLFGTNKVVDKNQIFEGEPIKLATISTQKVTATSDTKISDIATIKNGVVELDLNGTKQQVTISENMTIQNLVDELNTKGAQAEFSNGVLKINKGTISDTGNTGIVRAFDLAVGNTINLVYQSPELQVSSSAGSLATNSTKLSNLGVTEGEYDIYQDGIKHTVTISADDTIGTFINQLNGYGIQATLTSDGTSSTLKITGTGNSYIAKSTTSMNASNVVEKLFGNQVTEIYNYASKTLETSRTEESTVVTSVTEGTKLSELGVTNGEYCITKDGIKTTVSISSTDTVGSFIHTLKANGLNASLVQNGDHSNIVVSNTGNSGIEKAGDPTKASNIIDKLFNGKGITYSGSYVGNEVIQSDTSNNVAADENTLLKDLGVTSGEYYIYKDGVKYTALISADDTLGSFIQNLKTFGIQAGFVNNGNSSKLTLIGNGDSYIAKSNSATMASNVVEQLFEADISTSLDYTGTGKITSTITHTATATTDTLLSAFDTPWGSSVLKAEGDLVFTKDGKQTTVSITAEDTIGSFIGKLKDANVDANFVGGKLYITNLNGMTIDTAATTSSIINPNSNLHLTFKDKIDGYLESDKEITYTTNVVEEQSLSAASYADMNTQLKVLGISDGTFSVYRDGVKANININSEGTFGDLRAQIAAKFSDVDMKFEDGRLHIYSKDKDVKVLCGTTIDTSNFAAVTELKTNEESIDISSRKLYKVNEFSKLTTAGLFKTGDIQKGDFVLGNATITIDDDTTLADLISKINSSEDANATAHWDSINGNLVIKSRTTGEAFINIEAGTTNFTDILGFTSTERNPDGTVKSSRINIDTQQLGKNANVRINGTNYTSTSNVLTSDITRINGVTINLNGLTDGSAVTLKVEKDKETVANSISDVIDAYNELMKNVDKELARDGKLHDQSTLKMIRNQIRHTMTSTLVGSGVFKNLDAIGISVKGASADNISTSNEDIINLSFNKDKFMKAYDADSNAVKELLIGVGLKNDPDGTDGIFTKTEKIVEQSLASVIGYFSVADDSYKRDIKEIDHKIVKGTDAIERYRAQLTKKFSSMDMMIAKMQQQYTSFLGQ